MTKLLDFPDPVNDRAARTVAAGVVLLCLVTISTGSWVPLALLVYGFAARVATGPTLSPLGQLATRVVAPRLGASKPVPGPPKRFAQGIGFVFSGTAAVLWFGFGLHTAALVVVGMLAVPAFVEAAFGYCVGCKIFSLLIRCGLIPEAVCPECADLSKRYPERYATTH
ncbi:MAG: DUF4395 domain-containing protein [Actinobacteria bacterium]|nr:DUF4395 domain-containing protein [Actinomycetota bacterium]